jgi:hypothetical protein
MISGLETMPGEDMDMVLMLVTGMSLYYIRIKGLILKKTDTRADSCRSSP